MRDPRWGGWKFWFAPEAEFSQEARSRHLLRTLEARLREAGSKRREEVIQKLVGFLRPGCRLQDWQERQVSEQVERHRTELLKTWVEGLSLAPADSADDNLSAIIAHQLKTPADWQYKCTGRWEDAKSGAGFTADSEHISFAIHLGELDAGSVYHSPAWGRHTVVLTDSSELSQVSVDTLKRKGVPVLRLGAAFERFVEARQERHEAAKPKRADVPVI